MTRRIIWQFILSVTIICSAALFLFVATTGNILKKFAPFMPGNSPSPNEQPLNPPSPLQTDPEPVSKFYQIDTVSQFLIGDKSATDHSKKRLCNLFPHDLLRDIQPVLKTGHGVVNTRVQNSLDSCSACLDNVLIFSDYDEELNGRAVIDVIGDLSSEDLEQEQLVPYRSLNGLPVKGTILDPNI